METQSLSRRDAIQGSALAAIAAALVAAAPPPRADAASTAAAARAPGDWTTPGLAAPEDPNLPKFYRTPSGVKVQRLEAGSGPVAQLGDDVLFDYTLRWVKR